MNLSGVLSLIKTLPGHYQLPGNPSTDRYLVPLSGGGDSSVLAIVLKLLFPHVRFEYIFTDTKAEEIEVYHTLNKLEAFLGSKITRIVGEKGLYDLIDEWGGFLPSATDRWCTRALKLEPFREWIKCYEGIQKFMFIGIRADENSRLAFSINEVSTEMPFIDMGISRKHVFTILQETIGIPKYYTRRTRSGCSGCFYQRRSERTGLLQAEPIEFSRVMSYEKLAPVDEDRHLPAPSLTEEIGIAQNWMTLPLPTKDTIPGRVKRQHSLSLLPENGIFIGAEFFFDGLMVGESFIWHQRVVSYSSSLAGIKRQLQGRYAHLLSTYEALHLLSADEVREKAKFAIYYLQATSDVFDPSGPASETSYTWHRGESYKQMEHIVSWSTRMLHAEGIRQQMNDYASAPVLSWEYEQHQLNYAALNQVTGETGMVLNSMWFTPEEVDGEDECDEKRTPCPMCQI